MIVSPSTFVMSMFSNQEDHSASNVPFTRITNISSDCPMSVHLGGCCRTFLRCGNGFILPHNCQCHHDPECHERDRRDGAGEIAAPRDRADNVMDFGNPGECEESEGPQPRASAGENS